MRRAVIREYTADRGQRALDGTKQPSDRGVFFVFAAVWICGGAVAGRGGAARGGALGFEGVAGRDFGAGESGFLGEGRHVGGAVAGL